MRGGLKPWVCLLSFINLFSLQEMSKQEFTKGHQKVDQDDWLDKPQFKKALVKQGQKWKNKFWYNVFQRAL